MARRGFAVFAAAIVLAALAAHSYFARPRNGAAPSRRATPRQPETAVVGDAPSCGLEQLCGLCGNHNTTAVAVSLVAVVRDRAESLLRVLPSWARVAGVSAASRSAGCSTKPSEGRVGKRSENVVPEATIKADSVLMTRQARTYAQHRPKFHMIQMKAQLHMLCLMTISYILCFCYSL